MRRITNLKKSEIEDINPDIIALIPATLATQLKVFPVTLYQGALTVAVIDPSQTHILESVALKTGLEVLPALVAEQDMDDALARYYGCQAAGGNAAAADDAPASAISSDAPRPGLGRDERSEEVVLVSEDGWVMGQPDEPDLSRPSIFEKSAMALSPDTGLSPDIETRSTREPSVTLDRVSKPAIIKRSTRDASSVPAPASKPSKAASVPLTAVGTDNRLSPTHILKQLHAASDGAATVDCALQFLMHFSDRAAFFVIKKTRINGFAIKGDLTSQSAIRSFWMPLSAQSTFRQVIEADKIHLGPLGSEAADAILAAALGGRPKRILAIPVKIGHRVAGLFYADKLNAAIPPWYRLHQFAEGVAKQLKRLLFESGTF
ncbi:MAG: hypothetical protein QNJ97_08030 [Myxococcota bacterium]|nr:hypothetical protein [Myxococcota bacterium]